MRLRYFLIFIISFFVMVASEYLIYLSFHSLEIFNSLYLERALLLVGMIFPFIFITSMIYRQKHFSALNSWVYTVGALWFGIIFYLFVVAFIISILVLINNYLGFNLPIRFLTITLVCLALFVITYGIYNARNPKIVRWEIKSKTLAKLWKDKKIIFISDTHLGNMRREKFMKKIVDIINSEKPYITFNLGDLIDGPSFDYEKVFAPFDDLKATVGNYYVEGNHEGYSKEYSLFRSHFPKNLNDITNKKIIINSTQIIGLPYHKKSKNKIKNELNVLGYNKNMPSIILMHDPKNTSVLVKNNASLVLSGHTHGGQFFPITVILKILHGAYFHGVYYTANTVSAISSGVGEAMPPIRIGTNSEIVVLTIV